VIPPTAIPTVLLDLGDVITVTQDLVGDQLGAWDLGSDTAPLFLGIAMLILVFGLLLFIQQRFR
jgi:hypothetical protein